MNKEDLEFLKQLQHEMLTQDTAGQAFPRYWAIQSKKRIYDVNDDFNGYEIIWRDDSVGETIEEFVDYIKENEDYDECFDILEECKKHTDLVELVEVLKEKGYDIYLVTYREVYEIAENTLFLTLEECKKHIKINGYHYENPLPYAMTAWRSPQVERLFSIIENTNWYDFNNVKN